jgi:hypothetical protein
MYQNVGNGWAAAGAMRVLTTINHSSFSSQLGSQQNDLVHWVDEILTGVWQHQVKLRPFLDVERSIEGFVVAEQRDTFELRRPAKLVRGLVINGLARSDVVPVQRLHERFKTR